MQLRFDLPAPAGLDVTVHSPQARDDGDGWFERLLGAAPCGELETETALGWRLRIACAVVDGAHRVGARYQFFHFTAAVVATFADRAARDRGLPALVAWCQSGRPDLRGGPVIALAELVALPDDGPS
jgi:hypothetical protein